MGLDFETERREMVEIQLRRRGIGDERVLAAMLAIPREEFVPVEKQGEVYGDDPVPIGYEQTISQPYMTALMAEVLELEGSETVLEVGCGSGYAAAVLSKLARRVITMELIPGLARGARRNLARAGCGANVEVVCGDGSLGYPKAAPFDAISVAAGAPDIPASLLEELNDRGRLVIPVGPRSDQELRVIRKESGRTESHIVTQCRFVPLRGGEGWE